MSADQHSSPGYQKLEQPMLRCCPNDWDYHSILKKENLPAETNNAPSIATLKAKVSPSPTPPLVLLSTLLPLLNIPQLLCHPFKTLVTV